MRQPGVRTRAGTRVTRRPPPSNPPIRSIRQAPLPFVRRCHDQGRVARRTAAALIGGGLVADDDTRREVVVRRLSHARHEATNLRGGTLMMGTGDTTDFSPVELLLAGI